MKLSIVLLVFEWMAIFFGCYLIYQILDYLNKKPLACQTLLDGIRIQLFQYMIVECIIIGVVASFNICKVETHWDWIMAMVLGWVGFTGRMVFCIQLLEGVIVRYIVIFKPDFLEEYEDCKILKYSR